MLNKTFPLLTINFKNILSYKDRWIFISSSSNIPSEHYTLLPYHRMFRGNTSVMELDNTDEK